MAKLVDLNPRWVFDDQHRRIGVSFRYPVSCKFNLGDDCRAYVQFANTLDGAPHNPKGWQRAGETFETLTLTPSVLAHHQDFTGQSSGECDWHGFVTNGEVRTC